MSIRAYRIIEVIKKEVDSFNVWYDEEVVFWLKRNTNFFDYLDDDCCGLSEVSVEDLKRMIREIGDKIKPETKKEIEDDIEYAEERKESFIRYYCY